MTDQNKIRQARKGDLVQIHNIIFKPGERTAALPEVTKTVPYEGWVKGFLMDDKAALGDNVTIESFIGRKLSGILTEINPIYDHDFGEPQSTLNMVGRNAWKALEEKEGDR